MLYFGLYTGELRCGYREGMETMEGCLEGHSMTGSLALDQGLRLLRLVYQVQLKLGELRPGSGSLAQGQGPRRLRAVSELKQPSLGSGALESGGWGTLG